MIFRIAFAVVLAGIAGALANAAFAGFFVHSALYRLAVLPIHHALGIAFAVLLPLVYRLRPDAWGAALALALLTLLPSLLAKLALGGAGPWPELLAMNFTYALTALVVYRLVRGSAA